MYTSQTQLVYLHQKLILGQTYSSQMQLVGYLHQKLITYSSQTQLVGYDFHRKLILGDEIGLALSGETVIPSSPAFGRPRTPLVPVRLNRGRPQTMS